MLPDNLVSVYQQYKKDTNAVASWLASTAKSCGYPPDLLFGGSSQANGPERSKRLKGKARKEAKAAASQPQRSSSSSSRPAHTIAIKDFIPLAEFVAASQKPAVSVPLAFAQTLNRVIAARSEFSGRLAQLGISTDVSTDSKHSYFVGVLEKVREVLKPRVSPASQDAASAPTEPDPIGEIGGRFAGLSVYEPSEEFLNAPDIDRPIPVKDDNATYVAEPLKDLDEVLFAYTLLLNDLMVIRARIEWIWTNYGDSRFDLVAAAIATNTACDLARNLMDDIEPMLKPHGGAVDVGRWFYIYQCMMKGFSFKDIVRPGAGVNYDTYDVADITYTIPYMTLSSILDGLRPSDVLPLFQDEASSTYDPALDRGGMCMKDKFEQDKLLMMEMFTDLTTLVRCVPNFPVHDELIRGMQELDRTKEIPMYLAFATQIFLDIHHTLGARVYWAFERCMSHMRLMDEDLRLQQDFHAKFRTKTWTASSDRMLKALRENIKAVQNDPIHKTNVEIFRDANEPFTAPSHRIMRYSPVISGLMLYHFRTTAYKLSLQLVDSWSSIIYPLHLYNALQQEKLLSPLECPAEFWEDMTMAQALLGKESFYVGSELPQNPENYMKRLGLQIGLAANAFTNRNNSRFLDCDKLFSKSGPRPIKSDCAPVADMFIDRYVRNTGQVDWTPEHVDRVISRSLHEEVKYGEDVTLIYNQIRDPDQLRERKRKIAAEAAGKRAVVGARMDPDKLIKGLVIALEAEAVTMVFPYLTLHRAAWGILHAIRDACDQSVLKLYGFGHVKDEARLPQVVASILMALAWGDDRLFVKAGEAIKEQLRQGEGARAKQRLQGMGFRVVKQIGDLGSTEGTSYTRA